MTEDEFIKTLPEEAHEWFRERPQIIKDMMVKTPPTKRYMLNGVEIDTIYSYLEDGTLTVLISKTATPGFEFPRQVFDVQPEDLIEIV